MRSAAEPPSIDRPHRLLWLAGIAAFVLCFAAFVLWGVNGASTIFDLMVALCS
jgi:hypothetical protein